MKKEHRINWKETIICFIIGVLMTFSLYLIRDAESFKIFEVILIGFLFFMINVLAIRLNDTYEK